MSKEGYEYLDTEVIKRFKQGDQVAFDEIYKKYYRNIYYLGYHYFHNEEKAKDIVQETFMNVCKYINRLESEEAFFVWMNRIAYNCCNNLYRKSKKDASHYKDEDEDGTIENSTAISYSMDYGGDMEMSRAKEVIVTSLEDMGEESRAIGYLCFFEELSYKEIAEVLDVPIGTVKSRINRIKKRLKTDLEKNKITRNSCFSLLLIPNLGNIYKEYVQTIPIAKANEFIFTDVGKSAFVVDAVVKHIALSKIFAIISIVALPIGSVIYANEIHGNIFKQDDFAKIKHIEYNAKLTNESILIKVDTTNDQYDDIHVNGTRTLTITKNGVYNIALLKEGNIIDSRELDIKNIDKEPPVTTEVILDDLVEVHMSDDNGIDFQRIEVIENGSRVNDFAINKVEGILYFPKDITKKSMVRIPDLAGNIAKVEISFKEVSK